MIKYQDLKIKLFYLMGKSLFLIRRRKLHKRIINENFFLHRVKFEGIKIYYYTNFKKKPPANKRHLILLHGFLDSSHTFRKILKYLKNDYNVYIIDLPGHGRSKVPFIRELWQISSLARGLYRFIFEYLNIKKPIFLTHSMGGFLVFHMLLYSKERKEYPHQFNCILFAIAPGMLKFDDELREKNMQLFFPDSIEDIDNLLKNLFPVYVPEIPIFIKYYLLQEWNHMGMKYITLNTLENEDKVFFTIEKLNKSPHPEKTYLIWGEQDKIIPIKYGYKLKQIIHNAEFITIKDTGHTPHSERPEEFYFAIKSYLNLYK